jgi:membrane-bound serine protease (ClpP class)
MPQLPADKPRDGQGGTPAGEQDPTPQPGTPMERKIVNDAVAYIQSLAQLRGRNGEWAERAVRHGASLSAEDALEQDVIDLIAPSLASLLQQLHGRQVVVDDAVKSLEVEGLAVYQHPTDWRSEFLAVITDPNIAYILMLVGIYGLIIEFYNPGFGVPGVVGAVCLLLALYAFQVLPISYSGLALILLGIALMVAEAFAPSFGILGLGGIVAFIVGSIMLMDTQLPGYQIAMPMIVAFAVFSVALLAIALGLVMRARRRQVVTGVEHLLGMTAPVESLSGDIAWVRLEGELWEAASKESLAVNDRVTVNSIDGLTLQVSKQRE